MKKQYKRHTHRFIYIYICLHLYMYTHCFVSVPLCLPVTYFSNHVDYNFDICVFLSLISFHVMSCRGIHPFLEFLAYPAIFLVVYLWPQCWYLNIYNIDTGGIVAESIITICMYISHLFLPPKQDCNDTYKYIYIYKI